MNTLKLLLVLMVILLGLINRRHVKIHHQEPSVLPSAAQAAINQDILQNAERLTETLRRCKQTAQINKETKR